MRSVFRQPALGLAEIVWRWTTWATGSLLFCFLLLEYLHSLPLSKADLLLLRSGVPGLVLGVLRRVLLSGAPRFFAAALICFAGIGVVWAFAASAGRNATINVLLDHFQLTPAVEASGLAADPRQPRPARFRLVSRVLILLHLLRAALLVASLFALIGAAMLARFITGDRDPGPGIAFAFFLLLSWLIAILWCGLNWVLSIAPIFAVRDRKSLVAAISAALSFVSECFGAVVRTSALFSVIHILIFFVAMSFMSSPLAIVGMLPGTTIFLCFIVVTLVYFVLIDYLRVAKLAAYVCIAAGWAGAQAAGSE